MALEMALEITLEMTPETAMTETRTTLYRDALIVTILVFGAWCGYLTYELKATRPPVIMQLSVRQLFDEFIRAEAASAADPSGIEARTALYTQEINRIVARLSEDERVIVLVSEAVLSEGVVDITPEVRRILQDQFGGLEEQSGE